MARAKTTSSLYTLHVQLRDIDPPIWRQLNVPGDLTLAQLHHVLQVTMGWYHSHLHQFLVESEKGTLYYGEPSPEDNYLHKDDRHVRLASIAPKKGATFVYEYDFGDSWRHLITVEGIHTVPKDEAYPWCLDGQRAAPPEDVGGSGGFAHFLEAWHDRSDDEHQQMRQWVGKHYQPEVFSVQQANSAVCLLISLWSQEARK